MRSIDCERTAGGDRSWAADGGGRLTSETGGNAETYRIALTSAGGAIAAAECAVDPESSDLLYALVRPSGHHAQSSQNDGFCFFNNVAARPAPATTATGTRPTNSSIRFSRRRIPTSYS